VAAADAAIGDAASVFAFEFFFFVSFLPEAAETPTSSAAAERIAFVFRLLLSPTAEAGSATVSAPFALVFLAGRSCGQQQP
jgi:hypothetical protein